MQTSAMPVAEPGVETGLETEIALASNLLDVYDQLPFEPVGGKGARLLTADGRELIDFYGGHAVALLGYRHPRLLAALERQSKELFFQSNAVPMAVRERAARKLAAFAPAGLDRVFFVNSGSEANENALRIARRAVGRPRFVALEGAFHGRTAAAAAVTWNAPWYGFPRKPFDVRFVPREDLAALESALQPGDVAAVIVEPVQGVAGAVALSDDWLRAARRLTADAGTLLIFDEVQCGMGRCGAPFVAQAASVTPDILTTAKGIAGGFPAGAVLVGRELAALLKRGELGTTFGGGPLAAALIEATLAAIDDERLLDNVRARAAQIRATCLTGPVTEIGGRGLLVGLRTRRPAKGVQKELLARGIVVGTSSDPSVVRLLPPLVVTSDDVELLAAALAELPGVNRFHALAELSREEIGALLALAARLERAPEPNALAGKLLGLLFFNPSLRTLASMQAAMHRLGGDSIVLSPGQGSWPLETRDGARMDGAAAEHVREAIPVLSGYVDALGIRSFAGGTDLAADLADDTFRTMSALASVPTINLESALDHPCQALGDWKTLDELNVPANGKLVLSWANHPKPLPLAVPATVVQMAAARGMKVVVLRPDEYALPEPILARARAAAQASGGSVTETSDRAEAMDGAFSLYGKSWSSPLHYGDATAERELRVRLTDWTIDLDWFERAAPGARFFHCLPVRRNVVVTDAVLDSPRSAVVRQAHNRLWAQMAVLHTLLGGPK